MFRFSVHQRLNLLQQHLLGSRGATTNRLNRSKLITKLVANLFSRRFIGDVITCVLRAVKLQRIGLLSVPETSIIGYVMYIAKKRKSQRFPVLPL